MRRPLTFLAVTGFMTLLGSAASALPVPSVETITTDTMVQKTDAICGPGYHLGWGGRRCWGNGWAPVEEIRPGFIPPPREPEYLYAPPPVIECPPGFHLGRGLRRCWPD